MRWSRVRPNDELRVAAEKELARANDLAQQAAAAARQPSSAAFAPPGWSSGVERALALAAESARAAQQAAFLVGLNLKLSESTHTWRAWQQVPAWLVGAAGVGLSFVLATQDNPPNAGWFIAALMLVLGVMLSFRSAAQLGLGPGGDASTGEEKNEDSTEMAPADQETDGQHRQDIPQAGAEPPTTRTVVVDPTPEVVIEPPTPNPPGRAGQVGPRTENLAIGTESSPSRVLVGTGLDLSRNHLYRALDIHVAGERILKRLVENSLSFAAGRDQTFTAERMRGERRRVVGADLGDPKAAGWSYLVAEDDPDRDAIAQALELLAQHRGMRAPEPLVYSRAVTAADWMTQQYQGIPAESRPYYVMIVGGPERVPFSFQALLDSAGAVGRVAFGTVDELAAYAEKIVRLETAADASTRPEAVFFSPTPGIGDPTYFSDLFMAGPLAAHTESFDINVRHLRGTDATKAKLSDALTASRAAIVYTASHGLGATSAGIDDQRKWNGAICCQDDGDDWLFGAADVPSDEQPFLEGSVFFQFACFGYGTPAQSDFMHWIGESGRNSTQDFVAALPSRLLAHPRGPVAYLGHVDMAWLHGFTDPEDPFITTAYHQRLQPFQNALDLLLTRNRVGLALNEMNKRYDVLNGVLTGHLDAMQRDRRSWTPERAEDLASSFIFRGDAQNHMLMGDPATEVRIPD
jgi:hypothetical protein